MIFQGLPKLFSSLSDIFLRCGAFVESPDVWKKERKENCMSDKIETSCTTFRNVLPLILSNILDLSKYVLSYLKRLRLIWRVSNRSDVVAPATRISVDDINIHFILETRFDTASIVIQDFHFCQQLALSKLNLNTLL